MVESPTEPLWKRLAWMAGIWAISVIALAVVAYGIKLWLRA
jgi:hypothetical protein